MRKAVDEELKLLGEYGHLSADTDARREKRLRDAPNQSAAILDAILEVRAEFKNIKELVTNPPKRGLFG